MNKILVVDDSRVARLSLRGHLEPAGYFVEMAEDGAQALKMLEDNPQRYSVVLLDRTMPGMDGIDVLIHIKKHETLKTMPVIMQTARDSDKEIREGLKAGAYYYLTKPYGHDTLLIIVGAAIADYKKYKSLNEETSRALSSIVLMKEGSFMFRTLDEADRLSMLMSQLGSKPKDLVLGLSELMINAIEHGNLGITYNEKSVLNTKNQWRDEVNRRVKLPENFSKVGTLEFKKFNAYVEFRIKDEGNGFDWEKYLEFSPDRAFDSHGRGIAMANSMSFDSLEYIGKGNEIRARVKGKRYLL